MVQVQRCLHTNRSRTCMLRPTRATETSCNRVGGYTYTTSLCDTADVPFLYSFLVVLSSPIRTEDAHDPAIAQANLHPWNPWRGPCASCPFPTLHFPLVVLLPSPPRRRGGFFFSTGGIDTNSTWPHEHRGIQVAGYKRAVRASRATILFCIRGRRGIMAEGRDTREEGSASLRIQCCLTRR